MWSLRVVAILVLFAAITPAQIPLRVSDHEIQQVEITATATPEELHVELNIEDGWRAYSRDVGGGNPVRIDLARDCDFVAKGPVELPEAYEGKVTGRARWTLPIQPRGDGKDLRAVVWFQVCDELMCTAPARVEVAGVMRAFSVLLVVGSLGDRSQRVTEFLKSRKFDVEVTTYKEVSASSCDRVDVVLADSKLFRQAAKVRQHVLKFPKTMTPIVAVGFFGTELIEAHGVAMTSGYI
jgi:hypothetical protein